MLMRWQSISRRHQPVQGLEGRKSFKFRVERPVWLEYGEQGRRSQEKRLQIGESKWCRTLGARVRGF